MSRAISAPSELASARTETKQSPFPDEPQVLETVPPRSGGVVGRGAVATEVGDVVVEDVELLVDAAGMVLEVSRDGCVWFEAGVR